MDGLYLFTMLVRFARRTTAGLKLSGCIMSVVFISCGALPVDDVSAEDSTLRFVEGLRSRQYFDTALEALDAAQKRPDLPEDIRDVIDLERAKILQAMGTASRVTADRDGYLQQAKEALQKFTDEHQNHPQAAFANSMLGELLLERARTLIWQIDAAETPDKRAEYQLAARSLIEEGQKIYQTAHDQYKSAFDAFPNFIDKTKDEDQFNARQEVEAKYLRAWFNLIRCTYERGQTFEKGSEDRRTTLIDAADLYEQLHTRYRTNQIGLHARLMMGKCFQEQDDLSRALGIYNEMLGHKSESESVEILKGIALHYRLICLNDPQRNDHQLVVQEATLWLQANKTSASSPQGIGILWERAIAAEKLGADRELSEKDSEATLRLALTDATTVARYQGPFREPANATIRRLKAALGDKDKEPKDFATAFERARGMIGQIDPLTDAVNTAADDNAKAEKKAALEAHLSEVGRLLQLALDLRDSESDPKAVAQTRYLQSFVMLKLGRPLDSVILARYCMIQDRTADPDSASNATAIAMAAGVAAWNMAPAGDRDFETRLLKDICQTILELYPQSSRAGEARMRLGMVYRALREPVEAAKWYLEVPETDPEYASARISAGQSYWAAWTQKSAVATIEAENPELQPAEMQTWKTEARNLLTQGIQIAREKNGDVAPSDEIIAAEVSLASIMNLDGEFEGAITRLTAGETNSVVAAIQVPDGETRPEDGVRSNSFASLTWRLLLRAYVGTQQIDRALEVMPQLEKVGGQDVLAVYTQLGLELQAELKRLKSAGDNERLAQTRDSFEKFLLKVYETRNKSDYNSLLWIGETYFGLGQGVAADPNASAGYFAKAADAYSEIISGGLATDANRTAVQLRLARCRRQQQQFSEAFQICDAILKSNPNALDAQFEVAHVLSDWGSAKEPAKLLDAIQGVRTTDGKAGNVWGWSLMSRKLQQSLQRAASPEMRARFLDARYELTNSRRRYAKTNAPDGDKQLTSALAEVTSFVQVYRDLDDASFAKFDRLYQDLQSDLGKAPKPLKRELDADEKVVRSEVNDGKTPDNQTTAAGAAAASPQAAPPAGNGLLLGTLVTCLSIGIGAVFFVLMRKPKRRPRIPGSDKTPKFSGVTFSGPNEMILPTVEDHAPGLDFSGLDVSAPGSRRLGSGRVISPAAVKRPSTEPPASVAGSKPSASRQTAANPAVGDIQSKPNPKPRPRPAVDPAGTPTAANLRPPVARPPATTDGGPAESKAPAARPPAKKPPTRPTAAGPPTPPAPGSSQNKSIETNPPSRPASRPSPRNPPAPPTPD